MFKKALTALGFVSFMALGGVAEASPVTTQPDALSVNGDVTVVFIGSDAGDTSLLSLVGGLADLFCNHSTSSCTAAAAGDTVDLGTLSGNLVFQLHDITVPQIYDTANAHSDGYYYAKVVSNYNDLGIFPIPQSAADIIASLMTSNSVVRYVAFEDRVGGDYDYNDFVFAVIDPPTNGVPEPASLFLVGAGLAGMAARRRRSA